MFGLIKLRKTNTDKNINREDYLSIQIEEKVRFGQVPSIFFYNLIKKKLLQMLLNRHS